MTVLNAIKTKQKETYTENGATAVNTTGSAVLDLFAVSGSLRYEQNRLEELFLRAYAEDPLLTVKTMFYTRDIRGGLGERTSGRQMMKLLARMHPDTVKRNLSLVPEYGRWDDLLCLEDTEVFDDAVKTIKEQLNKDIASMKEGKPSSLLAKWLPSINASSFVTVTSGRRLAEKLGMTEKTYRKTLSGLRAYLNITETRMSEKDYESIRYAEVPSVSMNRHFRAFLRNDRERFEKYQEDLKEGKQKINASVLYPYDIIEKYMYTNTAQSEILEQQWKALPDYVEGENSFLVMADVSGSMYGRPLATSVGLAMYFAERNKGPFHNHFMTFSEHPELLEIKGDSLLDRVNSVMDCQWDMNTNLEAAFQLVLDSAMQANLKQEDMPKSIVIISDMEFDACTDPLDALLYEDMKQRFTKQGYEIPNLVFWNVSSRQNVFHAEKDSANVQMASGSSPSVFKSLIANTELTPYLFMLSVLNTPRYMPITI